MSPFGPLEELRHRPIPDQAGIRARKMGFRAHPIDRASDGFNEPLADARGQGFRIIPFCPYVRARYLRNPAWQDVMTVAPGVVPEPCADET